MKTGLFVAVLTAITALIGCSRTLTEPSKTSFGFTTPANGQTLKLGDTVTVSWACTGCSGYTYTVWVLGQDPGGRARDGFQISPAALDRQSFSWTVGSTQEHYAILEGSYALSIRGDDPNGTWFMTYGPTIRLVK